jgi:DNA-binding NarL/FixJ family response regulator
MPDNAGMDQRAGPFRVYLVEDSPILRQRVETMLAALPGMSLVGVSAGATAAAREIAALKPDAVILDIHLAEGTGFDVLRGLKRDGVRTAVYVLTNYATDAYRATAAQLGARALFDKSTEFEGLRAALAAAPTAA